MEGGTRTGALGNSSTGRPESNGNNVGGGNLAATRNRTRRKRQNKLLKCMTINAQSLKYKMDEFKSIIEREKPHIISVTETWGKEWMGDAIFSLKEYNYYRDDREEKGGRDAVIYKQKTWTKGL